MLSLNTGGSLNTGLTVCRKGIIMKVGISRQHEAVTVKYDIIYISINMIKIYFNSYIPSGLSMQGQQVRDA